MDQDPTPDGDEREARPDDPALSDAPTHMGPGPLGAASTASATGSEDDDDTSDRTPPPEDPGSVTAAHRTANGHTFPGGLQRLGDRYALEEPIASGGAAIVWRAFDEVLSRSVAIKLLHPHLATDPTTVERFRLESINAARLTHPNVVAIYDSNQEGDLVYLVMEFVDGPSLRDLVRERGPLEPTVVAALGEQVAKALGEAHLQGVVHRDVKPANILLTRDGVAKVTDFGIAKALAGNQATLTSPGTVVGTAAYVAPEQLEGGSIDPRADVYALGVVLYECLTGQPAFSGDTPTATAAARLTQELLPPRQVRADIPRQLDDIIVRATRRDADMRYADGNALAAALAALVPSRPSDVTAQLMNRGEDSGELPAVASGRDTGPFSGGMPATRREYGRRLVAAFLGGLLLALIGFFATQALRDDPGTGASASPNPDTVAIRGAADFDPYADGQENPADVAKSYDGDLGTAWHTETYRTASTFGNLKAGVGVIYDLGGPTEVREIALDLTRESIDVTVYAADTVPDALERETAWAPAVGTFGDIAVRDTLVLSEPHTARYWLIWITDLGGTDDGTYDAGIAEIGFVGGSGG